MTQQRDITSLLDLWLAEGSSVAPDRVIDVVTDRIERQGQRGAWRFPARELHISALLRIAAVAAAIAVIGGAAILFAGSPRPSTAPPSPTPSLTAAVSSPNPTEYVLPSTIPNQTPQTLAWTGFRPEIHTDLPPGWSYDGSTQDLVLQYGPNDHPGGSVLFRRNPVFASSDEPCQGPHPAGVATSVAAIVLALEQDPRLEALHGADINVNGYPAQLMDMRLAEGFLGACPGNGDERSALLFDEPGPFIRLSGDDRVRLVLVDVGDVPVLIYISPDEEAYDAFFLRAVQLYHDITFIP